MTLSPMCTLNSMRRSSRKPELRDLNCGWSKLWHRRLMSETSQFQLITGSFLVLCDDEIVKESAGPKFAMYFTVTPVSELSSIAWTYVAKDYENIPDEETRQFEDMITWQDVPIVESQRPELLPLDLQAELHLRSDRTAIAYRKWLRELGLTFGTA